MKFLIIIGILFLKVTLFAQTCPQTVARSSACEAYARAKKSAIHRLYENIVNVQNKWCVFPENEALSEEEGLQFEKDMRKIHNDSTLELDDALEIVDHIASYNVAFIHFKRIP